MHRRLWGTVLEGFTHKLVLFLVACDGLSHTHTCGVQAQVSLLFNRLLKFFRGA